MNRCVAALSLLLAASACSQHRSRGSGTPSAALDPDSGEARAIEAGRALIGKPAPAALLHTVDGEAIDLAKLYGHKPVYLKFWATWCIPCRQQMPAFEADFEKYRNDVVTIAVNTGFNDDLAHVRKYRAELGLKMPIVIDDGSLAAALNLRVTPQHVVIGRNGRILFVGHLEDDRLHAAFRDAVAEAPAPAPAPSELKPPPGLDVIEPPLARAAGFPLSGPVANGKPRVLVFFSPWCESYWKESRPAFAAACQRVREETNRLAETGGAHLLGIASGLWASQKDLAEFRTKKDSYRMPLYLDANGAAFRAFGVRQVPTVIFIDKSGGERRFGPEDQGLSAALSAARTHG